MHKYYEQLLSKPDKFGDVALVPDEATREDRAELYCELTKGMVFGNEVLKNGAFRHSDFLAIDDRANPFRRHKCVYHNVPSPDHEKELRIFFDKCDIDQILCLAVCSKYVRDFLNGSRYHQDKFWLSFSLKFSGHTIKPDSANHRQYCLDNIKSLIGMKTSVDLMLRKPWHPSGYQAGTFAAGSSAAVNQVHQPGNQPGNQPS